MHTKSAFNDIIAQVQHQLIYGCHFGVQPPHRNVHVCMGQLKRVELVLGSEQRQPLELANFFVYHMRLLHIYF